MKIWTKDIDKFKAIFKDKFSKDLSDTEALEYATALLNLTKILIHNKNNLWN